MVNKIEVSCTQIGYVLSGRHNKAKLINVQAGIGQ